MPYKDYEKQKEYQRKWIMRKRNGIDTKIVNKLPVPMTIKRAKKNANTKKYKNQRKMMMVSVFGTNCFICGRCDAHIIHRNDGTSHKFLSVMGNNELRNLIEKDKDLYVKVCKLCHKGIHWSMKFLSQTWDQIEMISKNIG